MFDGLDSPSVFRVGEPLLGRAHMLLDYRPGPGGITYAEDPVFSPAEYAAVEAILDAAPSTLVPPVETPDPFTTSTVPSPRQRLRRRLLTARLVAGARPTRQRIEDLEAYLVLLEEVVAAQQSRLAVLETPRWYRRWWTALCAWIAAWR